MPKGTNQKFKLYYLSRIMLEKTDDDHMIDMSEIKTALEAYGVTADRKSLYDDLEALRVLGVDVIGEKVGRNYYYHVGGKQFEIAELKLLVDAIQSSKFITEKKSKELIKKLTDMESHYEAKLYEKFILEYYNQEHKELDASASQIPWGLDDGIDAMLPVMQTDITLTQGEKTLIIDAKYYSSTLQQHFDRMTIYSNNLYQIFTYVKNKEVELKDKPHEISGMLLYAKTEEETYPDNDYKMSGNDIGVHTLNLNVEFSDIRKQLDAIAERHFSI